MTLRLPIALLRTAALLTPAGAREDWLAEWLAELWYVPPARRLGFCMGAFRDAWWLRRHNIAPVVHLASPWRCLGFLAAAAAVSILFAFRLPDVRETILPPGIDNPDRLATISAVPLDDYRVLARDSQDFAFYRTDWLQVPMERTGSMPVTVASRNLFAMLHIPAAIQPNARTASLILSRHAWRSYFAGDPRIVGRRVAVDGYLAEVTAVISDRAWRLAGRGEAWLLLDDEGLAAAGNLRRGYVLSRAIFPLGELSVRYPNGDYDRFAPIPLVESSPLWPFVAAILLTAAILPTLTSFSLGEYPVNHSALSRPAGMRRWLFLAAKILLILPIVLFGSLDVFSPIARNLEPHAMVVTSVIAFRWVLADQRWRCPTCLRRLSNPMSVGQPSRTFLEWYGTELVCSKGHGLLHVPEIESSYNTVRWLHLDSSWSELFAPSVRTREL